MEFVLDWDSLSFLDARTEDGLAGPSWRLPVQQMFDIYGFIEAGWLSVIWKGMRVSRRWRVPRCSCFILVGWSSSLEMISIPSQHCRDGQALTSVDIILRCYDARCVNRLRRRWRYSFFYSRSGGYYAVVTLFSVVQNMRCLLADGPPNGLRPRHPRPSASPHTLHPAQYVSLHATINVSGTRILASAHFYARIWILIMP